MDTIFRDEIAHVGFGWHWLQKLKGADTSAWDAWTQALPPYLAPKRAKGFVLNEEPRLAAGIPHDWISRIKNT